MDRSLTWDAPQLTRLRPLLNDREKAAADDLVHRLWCLYAARLRAEWGEA